MDIADFDKDYDANARKKAKKSASSIVALNSDGEEVIVKKPRKKAATTTTAASRKKSRSSEIVDLLDDDKQIKLVTKVVVPPQPKVLHSDFSDSELVAPSWVGKKQPVPAGDRGFTTASKMLSGKSTLVPVSTTTIEPSDKERVDMLVQTRQESIVIIDSSPIRQLPSNSSNDSVKVPSSDANEPPVAAEKPRITLNLTPIFEDDEPRTKAEESSEVE